MTSLVCETSKSQTHRGRSEKGDSQISEVGENLEMSFITEFWRLSKYIMVSIDINDVFCNFLREQLPSILTIKITL
jgi:hypothetical protein